MCNFLEYKGQQPYAYIYAHLSRPTSLAPGRIIINKAGSDTKIVYRRYASLFFIAGCSSDDNELITLEIIHRYVEQMDKYYGNVCELDIIFSFTKAYYILDEILLAGELQESSKKNVLRCIGQQDSLEDMEVSYRQVTGPPMCPKSPRPYPIGFSRSLTPLTTQSRSRTRSRKSCNHCHCINCKWATKHGYTGTWRIGVPYHMSRRICKYTYMRLFTDKWRHSRAITRNRADVKPV